MSVVGSSRIRLILRARISVIHRRIARLFKPRPAAPSKADVSTPTGASRRSARSTRTGQPAPRRPPISADTPASRRSARVRRDTCPAVTVSTISRCSVAASRARRPTGLRATATSPDRHPRTTAGCPAPICRATSSPPPNVYWRRRPPRHPPRRRPVSVRFLLLRGRMYDERCDVTRLYACQMHCEKRVVDLIKITFLLSPTALFVALRREE